MHADYLYKKKKNLTTQSAHLNYAVLPKINKVPYGNRIINEV